MVLIGEWVPVPESFIEVDPDKCNGCGRCVEVCPANCYKIEIGKAFVTSLEKCYECEACYLVCEPEAIRFEYPKGGTGVIFKQG